MRKYILLSITTIALLLFSNVSFCQTLEFGTLTDFEAFAGVGAVANSGTVTGDAGTNAGAITGSYNGTTYNSSSLTVQARIDLLRVYIHLDDIFVTQASTHTPAFGSGETITPGVYSIGGAGSIVGALTLDGGGDPNAVFIMKFEGAFTVEAASTITLTNGTQVGNVFWIAQGAISVGTSSIIKGTLFAHPGAVTLGAGSTIEGRLLTSEGAITVEAGGVADMPGPSTIPISCLDGCTSAAVDLRSLKDFAFFTSLGAVANAATSGIVGDIGTNGGAIGGFETSTHTNSDATTGSFYNADAVTAQAKIDLNSIYTDLMALTNTVTAHPPAFGSGETLNTGVYHIAGAGSLAGTITLDGQNDPDAIFVFKFAGAFSVAAQSKVILINGARRCNVFWVGGAGVATGAVSLGTFTYMKGTLISHNGACTAGANTSVEGRMLSTGGAIGFSTGIVYNDELCFDNPCTDTDEDGICDPVDNCLTVPNPNQADSDGDGVGNVCDNCPNTSNANQADSDNDGTGDACECTDTDADGICDPVDNCLTVPNANQADSDGDGVGNACDNCTNVSNANQADSDDDGVGNACDNCPNVSNANQADSDGDGVGNACDNCPNTSNANQADSDNDGTGDACETSPCGNQGGDSDGDGVCNNQDCQPHNAAFPATPGSYCNDGNPNTNNDVVTANGCGCEGTLVGNCNVTVGNCSITITGLNSSDYTTVFDSNWSIVWQCNPWANGGCNNTETITGLSNGIYHVQACGDTDSYTLSGCNTDPCAGQGGDSDNDGVCNNLDCEPHNPAFPATPGSYCNDGNPNTNNDLVTADGCGCEGTPVGGNCNVTVGNCSITITGLNSSDYTKVFDSNWSIVWQCNPWANGGCNNTETITGLSNGTYHVQACGDTDSYTLSGCNTDPCAGQGGDSDNDGVCNNQDCQPHNAAFPATPGSYCNDNNSNTSNDIVTADGCDCEGTPIGGGNPKLTINDVTVNEDDGTAVLQVCLNTASSQTVSFDYTTADGSAQAGYDYDTVYGTKYISAGNMCTNITVPIVDDNSPESTESLVVNLSNLNNATSADPQGKITILDDDANGGPNCDAVDFNVINNNTAIQVSGLNAPIAILQVFDPGWNQIFACSGDCNETETIPGLGQGTYYVKVSFYTSSWQYICDKAVYIVCGGSNLVSDEEQDDFFFTAVKDNRDVRLAWTTNTEFKNDMFVVERSSNGVDFEAINQVVSDNDEWNTFFNYTEADQEPQVGSNYYRIKKMHKDGTVKYSIIRDLTFDLDPSELILYPNPASNEVFLNIRRFAGQEGSIKVVNALGQTMTVRNFAELPSERIPFSLDGFASGLYTVTLHLENGKTISKKLIVNKI
jgi:hypothetical protein